MNKSIERRARAICSSAYVLPRRCCWSRRVAVAVAGSGAHWQRTNVSRSPRRILSNDCRRRLLPAGLHRRNPCPACRWQRTHGNDSRTGRAAAGQLHDRFRLGREHQQQPAPAGFAACSRMSRKQRSCWHHEKIMKHSWRSLSPDPVPAGPGGGRGSSKKCKLDMLKGLYVFNATGFQRPPGDARPPWVPKAILSTSQFNGDGSVSTPMVTVANFPPVPFDSGNIYSPPQGSDGTYTVDPDCTGTISTRPGWHTGSSSTRPR